METPIEKQITDVIEREKNNFPATGTRLGKVFETLEKFNLPTKTEYSLPPQDTIGRALHEKMRTLNEPQHF